MSLASRKFERMFPGIAAWEKAYERDLLSHGRTTAERNRQLTERAQHTTDNTQWEIIWTFFFNFETGEETFVPANTK